MKKLPNGISDYERLVENNYLYVDKTKYIEELEDLSQPYIMFLRPRKFGKTLFTSVLENYYDILKENKFDELFSNTYIGKNATKNKNSYCILKFNFSGINTETEEGTMRGFKREVSSSINVFINRYDVDFYINMEDESEDILDNLFKAFRLQKQGKKIYVIIDEYDHFANELLGFHTEKFKSLVSKNGRVSKWYEILKKGTETVVDRIFITGVAPITLDSLTSGFNISKDITRDEEFNEMVGFNQEELIDLMNLQEIAKEDKEEILPIMKENYDGYRFSINAKNYMYNSNMCLFFLSDYIRLGKMPEQLIDVNIASDYSKLGKMLDLCKGEDRLKIMEDTVSGKGTISELTEKFNPAIDFTEKDLVSMLYYLGYLTITGRFLGKPILKIPNKVMKEIYTAYFLKILKNNSNVELDEKEFNEILEEIAIKGGIEKLTSIVEKYLQNLSNRDFIKFDEKYVKIIFYCILMNLKFFNVKSEMEVNRHYPDLLIIPREEQDKYFGVMIEFKYLKKGEEESLAEKQKEAKEQIEEYAEFEEIKNIPNLNKYTVVAVVDKIYVEKID